jgi:hypothetical protein
MPEKTLLEKLYDAVSILKVRLGFYHNNSLVYTNKRLFSLSLVALMLVGSYSFAQITNLGSIESFYSATVSIKKIPKNYKVHHGSYGFKMQFNSGGNETNFCDLYN